MLDALPSTPVAPRRARVPVLPERFMAPPEFVWGEFTTRDGATLRWGALPVAAPRAACVLVTGFREFIEKQFETVRDLAAQGIAVWCLDWRGQGRSSRPRRWPTRPRARRFERDAADLAEFAAAKLDTRLPRILIAHSMGGAIALLSLHARPDLFDGAILSSPMLGLRLGRVPPASFRCITGPMRIAGLGARLVPGTRRWPPASLPSPERSRNSSDPERCRLHYAWVVADPSLRLDGPTFGWVDSTLAVLGRIGRADFLGDIQTPILLGSAGRDAIVSRTAHRRAARLLPDCTLVELPESKHEPFFEHDAIRDEWFAQIDRFLTRKIGAPPRPADFRQAADS
ncbi:MAG TPA: alpha/beta hydrolase [Stellaceae bacterium]|nr:alpha/beta hydrolase [Stellaceae bacterium]